MEKPPVKQKEGVRWGDINQYHAINVTHLPLVNFNVCNAQPKKNKITNYFCNLCRTSERKSFVLFLKQKLKSWDIRKIQGQKTKGFTFTSFYFDPELVSPDETKTETQKQRSAGRRKI